MSGDGSLITLENDGGSVALPPEYTEAAAPEQVAEVEQPEQVAEPVAQPQAVAELTEEELQPTADDTPAMRGLKADLIRTRREAKTYKGEAEAVKTLKAALSARPDIVEALRTGRPLTAPQQQVVEKAQQQATSQPAARSAEEERNLMQFAESLSLFDVNGRPDIEAAARVAGFTRAEAQRAAKEAAEAAMRPLKEERVSTQAQQMRREAIEAADKFGLSREFAEPIIDNLVGQNPELASDPNNMSTALLVAAGLKYVQEYQARATQPAPAVQQQVPAPVFRENGGGKPAAQTMSNLERTIASQVGAKEADWQQHVGKLSNITDSTKLITMEID
jgi:hypothetical protein